MRNELMFFAVMMVVLAVAPHVGAQTADSEAVKNALKTLEERQKILEENYKSKVADLNRRFATHADTLAIKKREIDQLQKEMRSDLDMAARKQEDAIARVQADVGWIKKFLGGLAIFTVVSIIGLLITIFQYAGKKAKELFEYRFHAEFDRHFKEKEATIRAIIDAKDEESQIKTEKSVLVLSGGDASDSFAVNLLEGAGFKKLRHERFRPDVIFRGEDVALVDDETGGLDEAIIKELAGKIRPESVFFYFGPKRIMVEDPAVQSRIAFANVKFQLYGNLFSALRYQESLGQRADGNRDRT